MMKHWLTGAAAFALMTNVALAEGAQRSAVPPDPRTEDGTAAGTSTKALQESLNQNGASLAVDGTMGTKTTAAIADFQFSHGLQATGKLDEPTQAALDFSAAQMRADAEHARQMSQPASEAPSTEPPHMVGPASLGFSIRPDTGHSHIE